jgi:hypothetical protein
MKLTPHAARFAPTIIAIALLATLMLPQAVGAGLIGSLVGVVGGVLGAVVETEPQAPAVSGSGPFVLYFDITPNLARTPTGTNPAPKASSAVGKMVISLSNGKTDLQFSVRNARPDTIYTIWTVFYPLKWPMVVPEGTTSIARDPNFPQGPPGYYTEGGAVAPTASIDAAFTDGMGLDPGVTFVTDDWGNGYVRVLLDYNILGNTYDNGPPVGNKIIVSQCVVDAPGPQRGACPTDGHTMRVTTTWLRKFIAQVPADKRAAHCANYNPSYPHSILWQCIDPATVDPETGNGLPRVWRFPFDHFRLAAHPDGLTHGFIGGNEADHVIDMVGRRCKLTNTCP